jgi:hypothetical protein
MKKLILIIGLFVFVCGGSALIHANTTKCTNSVIAGTNVNRIDSVVPGDTVKTPPTTLPDSTKQN